MVRAEHPLARRRAIPIAELSGYEWVIQERASPIRIAIDSAFHAAGAPVPANVTNTSSLLVMLAIIDISDAIATLSEEVAGLLTRGTPRPGLVALDLADTISVAPYFIIQNRAQRLSRAAEQVLERIVQAL